MERSILRLASKMFRCGVMVLFLSGLYGADHACGDSSGLNMEISFKQTQTLGDFQFPLGVPIGLTMVLKNVSGWPVYTEEGFSQVDLHKSLILTDPNQKVHAFMDPTVLVDTMTVPIFLSGRALIPAEKLSKEFIKTVTITDLRALFPVTNTVTGWYTIQAHQPFMRFASWIEDASVGVLGLLDDENNWRGTVDSNKLQFYISPDKGAQLQLRVLDESNQPSSPLGQVPVKLFDGVISPEDNAEAWSKREPVLAGTTNFDGLAVWGPGMYCRPEPEVQYTAVALYGNEYRSVAFKAGVAEGWSAGCGSIIARDILFGASAFPELSEFSLFASNSVWVKARAVIQSGHVGVLDQSAGLWLDSGVEVSIGPNGHAEDGVRIYGDSVKLWSRASVDDVYYNNIQNGGAIRGKALTPLSLPLPVALPPFPQITPGTKDVTVQHKKVNTLNPGKYRDVSVGIQGTLKLSGGVYHFRNLNLDANCTLVCLGPGPTEIRIKQRMYPGLKAKIGPSPQSNLRARDVVFYIAGTNGNLRDLFSYPRAAEIGSGNEVKANMYVPNGTLSIDARSDVLGSFIAQGVVVGINARVNLDSGF